VPQSGIYSNDCHAKQIALSVGERRNPGGHRQRPAGAVRLTGHRRRARPADTARTLHRLVTELAALAAAASVTKRVTLRHPPAGTLQTSPLFDALSRPRAMA
jgi:hypothetical protein